MMELKQENIQTQPTYLIGVDTVAYSHKPEKGIMGWIKSRLAKAPENTTVTLQDIITAVKQGQSICPAELNTPVKSHCANEWKSQQIFFVDIDNAVGKDENGNSIRITDAEYISVSLAQQILRENNINAFFIYKSFSYTSDFEKFRICVRLDELITDPTERDCIINALIHIFGKAADENCTNRDRIFYGSTPDCSLYENTTAITDKQTVLTLYNKLFPKSIKTLPQPQLSNKQTQLSDATEWYHEFDYDIDKLLYCLDPNADYETWKQATLAYKLAGGDKETWMDWSIQSSKWDEKTDPKLWDNIGNNGILQNNYLKKLAKQTIEGQRYMDDMKQAQQNAKQQYKDNVKQNKKSNSKNDSDKITINIITEPTDDHSISFSDDDIVNVACGTCIAEFNPQFVYYPYIPKHDYTVILAESGIGKSIFCCGLSAAISKGTQLPGDTCERKGERILYVNTEDSNECINTRIKRAGADLNNVFVCGRKEAHKLAFYGQGLIRLHKLIQTVKPVLVIMDPWQAFMPASANINQMNQLRHTLSNVAALAEDTDCGIILVSHVNKRSQGENANNAASGSTELINMSRSALKIERAYDSTNPKNTKLRLAIHTKSNYAEVGKTIMYSLNNGYVTWNGFSDVTKSTIELAASKKISVFEALKTQTINKEDYKDLIAVIVDLANKTTTFPAAFLYKELEEASPVGIGIWNDNHLNQKNAAIQDITPILEMEYHIKITTKASIYKPKLSEVQSKCKGRGIIIDWIVDTDT